MRGLILTLLLACGVAVWSQSPESSGSSPSQSPSANTASSNSQQNSSSQQPAPSGGSIAAPAQQPARSDRIDPGSVNDESGDSSSKDSPTDISPPANDVQIHPRSSQALLDAEMSDNPGGNQVHPWDPHKAAKDIEVGDYYLKVRKNYRAAEDRYREALYYKENDAMATFGLAICFEKLNQPDEARQEYEAYLKILPDGKESKNAHKALARLKGSSGGPTQEK
jgi:tetratricopeptide (TPR) repeat protein